MSKVLLLGKLTPNGLCKVLEKLSLVHSQSQAVLFILFYFIFSNKASGKAKVAVSLFAA